MYVTTREWLMKRADESGIEYAALCLEPDESATFSIEISYDDKADETIYLGKTMYEVNVADWLAEQCRIEAQKEFGIYGEIRNWSIELYTEVGDEEVVGKPLYRTASDS